jgi:hypothetical protein
MAPAGAPERITTPLQALYKEQWTKLLDMADDIRAFIRSNEASLTTKT